MALHACHEPVAAARSGCYILTKPSLLSPSGASASMHQAVISPSNSHVLLKSLHKRRLGNRANHCLHFLSILEDHDGGDASNAVVCCNLWALICVQLELQGHQPLSKQILLKYNSHHAMLVLLVMQATCSGDILHSHDGLTAVILPSYSRASSSTIGAIMRQGPHHGAQKSMRTGTLESRTFSLKSVSLTGPAASNFQVSSGLQPLHLHKSSS